MELKVFRFLVQSFLLCFLEKSSILAQASQDAGNKNDQTSSYFFYQQPEYPRDCKEIQQDCSAQNSSRIHLIKPDGFLEPFLVNCENEWMIIHRRENDFIDFNRNWTDYNDGFGFLNADFWIGNEKLAYLTNQKQYELMINFETDTGDSYHVTYSMFRISDEHSDYSLISVGNFTGETGSLTTSQPIDCADIHQAGNESSGVYVVNPTGWQGGAFSISCDMDTDGGNGRRNGGGESFALNWNSYKEGFGTVSGEFWMGNEKLAFLTNKKRYELRIYLTNEDGTDGYVKHDFFRITDESDNYRLIGLGNYEGTTENGYNIFRYHHYMEFSTIDRDNDVYLTYHCASKYNGGWWYNNCYYLDLNKPSAYCYYYPGSNTITYSEMKIRPVT